MRNMKKFVLAIFLFITVAIAAGCQMNATVSGETAKPVQPTFPTETADLEFLSSATHYEKFVGPDKCMDCHEEKHESWKTSWHTVKATEGPAQGAGLKNVWSWVPDRWNEMESYVILDQKDKDTLYVGTRRYELNEVEYIIGAIRKQRYMVYYDGSPQEAWLATTEDGGISYTIDKSETVQFEGNKERAGYNFLFIELTNKEEIKGYMEFRSWQERCISCHTTGFNPDAWAEAKDEYVNGQREDLRDLFVTDIRISCESCHGPGLEHSSFPLREGTIINPAKLDKDDPTRKLVCEQCHTRTQTNIAYGNGANDNRGFKLGEHVYTDIMQYTRPAWGKGNRQTSIDGKGRRDHQQDMDMRLQDHINGGETIHGAMACFDCHDSHNIGNNPDNKRTYGATPESNCVSCHGLKAADYMKVLNGAEGWESYGFGNWDNEGGRSGNKQHIFNFDEDGRSFGLTPDQYVWALIKDSDPLEKDSWEAIWPWEKDLYREKGQRVVVGVEPWNN
jgi:hypothetical protein